MARITKPLTNTEVDRAKAKDKDYTLADGKGLYLLVKFSGSKLWRFSYYKPFTEPKKRALLGIGKYPDISLAQARKQRDEYLALLAQNIDPQIHRQQIALEEQQKLANTFYSVAERWKAKRALEVEPLTMEKNWLRLEKHIFSKLGNIPITAITPTLLIESVKHLDKEGKSDTLHRVLRLSNNILNFAVNTGVLPFNYCEKVGEAYHKKAKVNNPTIRPEELPQFFTALVQSKTDFITKYLIQWQLLTMVRPAEAVSVEWSEIDWNEKLWHIPAEKMKKTKKGANSHTVPLSTQALAILRELQAVTGSQRFVFTHYSKPNHSMNKETANTAIKRMGYKGRLTSHGLRSIASTYLNELMVHSDVVEACLAHAVEGDVRRVYNRSNYLEHRKPVMQQWGDYCQQCGLALALVD
ncbi:tyrosine-type recombinase/integrase [Pasteurella multocida]|uniref:tyrosine-type recombinase/integrase n=1 Tax=Pasteurella multocida TaxID=747 RepID=UPI00147C2419|nr:integrase arm-type DNA-binding domain-containing protein [Pasteurella multocida]MBM2609385.1 tyrosine-type recombinase/integrase [Pasteurella multocida]NNI30472.1 preprotein translocase [Pasteurella multocida]NNI60812.1 preprotein translocase [Pasteurella multocida]NNI75821.1 preprotein translocase [Pasteurella multocida]